jgi:riboflavin synthase
MFSGIIAYRGVVELVEGADGTGLTLRVRCEGVKRADPAIKDSVAIDGVCLTVTARKGKTLQFDVIPETLACSNLGDLCPDDVVNVEYALRAGDRMGGHFVYGHVDTTVRVLSRKPEGQGERMRLKRPPRFAPMLVEKAFVALDGVSLTIAATGRTWFEVALIPETLARTGLGDRRVGGRINLEIDPIARYVAAIQRGGDEER